MVSVEKIEYYKPHWHDEMLEILMVLEGSIDASIGCDNYRMCKGNILLIGTEDVHSYRKTNEENTVLFLRFDCKLLENEFPGITGWNLTEDPSTEKSCKNEFDRLRVLIVETALNNSIHNVEDKTSISRLLNYCRDKFLSTNLLLKQDITTTQIETFQQLSSYIQKNYTKQVTLGDVSEFINYSLNHTSFIIKQITGMTFTEYLNHKRCLAAERLIVSTDRNITDIAQDCGFCDARTLGKYFKNWFKLTPGEYRKLKDETFPNTGLASFEEIDLNNPEIIQKIETFSESGTHTIILDFSNLPHGTVFLPPVLGQPEKCVNLDSCNEIPHFIEGILDGRIKRLKQTDDSGPFVFHGDCGLATHRGIKKAVFHIYDFLSSLKSIVLKEEGIAAGIFEKGLKIILYPSLDNTSDNQNEIIRFILNSSDEDYIIKRFIVDYSHGNPQRMWEMIDSPAELSGDLEELFITHSIPELSLSVVKNRSSFELTEKRPHEGAVMIEIVRKKSV